MLQNAYFLAKIGADTAENEQHFAEILPKTGAALLRAPPSATGAERPGGDRRGVPLSEKGRFRVKLAKAPPAGSKLAKFAKNIKKFQMFGGLVLGCMKTKFGKKIYV